MTNFEKYREEIEKLKNKYSFTLDLDGNVADCNNIPCCNCKFQDFATCKNSRINWLFKEYEESILSDDELDLIKAIGKATNKKYKYLAKQKGGRTTLFTNKPFINNYTYGYSYTTNNDFADISNKGLTLFENIKNESGIYDIENKCFIKEYESEE